MTELPQETRLATLEQYSDPAKDVAHYELSDGRIVIGTVVDTDNHLHYVIRNEDATCEIADAESVHVSTHLKETPSESVVVTFKPPQQNI